MVCGRLENKPMAFCQRVLGFPLGVQLLQWFQFDPLITDSAPGPRWRLRPRPRYRLALRARHIDMHGLTVYTI